MAASDAQPMPVRNRAYRETFPMFTSAGALVTTGTMTVTISKDAGTFGNPSAGATTATQIATSSGVWYVDLSSTDMNCETLVIKCTDGTNPPTIIVIKPYEIKQLSGVPGFSDGFNGIEELLSHLLAMSRNKMLTTSSSVTLYQDDGTTVQASHTHSDDGTTYTRNELA